MPGAAQGEPGVVALHRARFVNWQPSAVVAAATSGDGSVVAAAREDGALELYETSTGHCFQRVPGQRDACLTCVALVDEEEGSAGGGKPGLTSRLFTGGLDGALVEWDVEQRRTGPAADSLGGAVWQLAPEPGACIKSGTPARIAAACDDGCARIFQAEAGARGLAYVRTLSRVEGRTLAVAWHPSGKVLATAGTDGCIHLWTLDSGREVLRITARDGGERGAEACIWSLLVLPDGTVVSGDSNGSVQFWDGRFGTLLARFSQHQADVLQLAASPDGNMVFAAGVDPQLALFHRVPEIGTAAGGQAPWAYLSSKRTHSHDVRALCVAGGRHLPEGPCLFSGSNDTRLFMHSVEGFLKEHPVAINPSPQLPLLQTASGQALPARGGRSQREQQPPWLLCAQRGEIDVWQLGQAGTLGQVSQPEEGALLTAAAAPQHLLRLVAQSGRHVVAACLSEDCHWLAYSDSQRVSCFALEQQPAAGTAPSEHVAPLPVPLPADLPPACHLAFRPGGAELVACSSDGTLRVVDVAACQTQQAAAAGDKTQGDDAAVAADAAPQVLRALHDLQYKSSLRRDRQRSAARRLMPLVELMALSPDGSWLAAVVRQRVHVLSLATHKLAHSLPPLAEPQPAITGVAFTADSATLVVAAATHQVAAYSVASGQPTVWTQQHGGRLPPKLLRMPGIISSIASSPQAPGSLFMASSQACCHLDMARPLEGGEGEGAGGGGRKRRRSAHKPVPASEPPGGNCRMIYCADPVLHTAYLGPDALLVVERPWEEVFKSIAAPMYRHRYGI